MATKEEKPFTPGKGSRGDAGKGQKSDSGNKGDAAKGSKGSGDKKAGATKGGKNSARGSSRPTSRKR